MNIVSVCGGSGVYRWCRVVELVVCDGWVVSRICVDIVCVCVCVWRGPVVCVCVCVWSRMVEFEVCPLVSCVCVCVCVCVWKIGLSICARVCVYMCVKESNLVCSVGWFI